MISKFIWVAVAFLALYIFMGGSFSLPSQIKKEKEGDDDSLEECEICNTYATRKESLVLKGKFYCSKECLNKHKIDK
ncbi:MAG: hypothetical protein HF962_04845 [Sulfurovum sp.]|nr:hypothetical protein [Sulfurovum sp.]